ncbi:predicted GPI-anchored protein 58 [Electrophorus electricus]|uniref:predicted GPI-anchored protein 58 n=1 Tax=Electrophorus electricus TaxID=8005 RepID=UPI000F0A5DAC|nr:predicted GPI-anchored protein 58 [Electrophorus electricus]XP_035381914.1 predicted GPI-anchored protein 58 [Electrophorus electricus]XP_035381915.1 predicted GPI-anchored protein 58 [Electrophorus electricus]
MEALQKYIQGRDGKESGRTQTCSATVATTSPSVPAPAPAAHLPGVSSHWSSTASRHAQEPSDAELLAVSMEPDTEASSSSAPEVPAPPQHSLPTAEPEKQPSQTQPVPTAEMSSTSPPLVLLCGLFLWMPYRMWPFKLLCA